MLWVRKRARRLRYRQDTDGEEEEDTGKHGIRLEVMEMNRKILVPLDGSELAEKALHYARVPAARIGAEVVLLHVCSPEECHSAADRCTVQPMHRVYTEHTAEMLRNELREVAANTIAVECKVLVGDPASEIVRFAEEQGVTRIIMASHGRSGVGRWIMGSVTDRVVRVSPVPVVIIRASAEDSARSDSLDRQILVLLDGSAMSEQVLPYAMEHAEMSGRGTVLLTVCETHSLESSFIYHLSQWDYPINEPIRRLSRACPNRIMYS